MTELFCSSTLVHRGREAGRRKGFTLVELMVSLTVGGIVLLLAHALLSSVIDATARSGAAVAEATRSANRHLWLVRTFGSAVVGSEPPRGFRGLNRWRYALEADEIEFAAMVRTPRGHEERFVRLELYPNGRLIAVLRASLGAGDIGPDTAVLADELLGFGAEYLIEYGADARWVSEWVSPVSAPVAARLRLDCGDQGIDTLVVHIGARG